MLSSEVHPSDPRARYWEDRLRKNWSLAGVGYLGYGVHYNRWLYRLREHVFAKHVAPLCQNSRDLDVIDVGSGTGFYVDLWMTSGARSVTACDISPFAVQQLAAKYPTLKVCQLDIGNDLDNAAIRNEKFAIVSAFDVLFHIISDEKYQRAIANISALCAPGGYFVFSENLPRYRAIRTQEQANRRLENVSSLLEASGFRIIRKVPMFVLMNTPVDTRREWPLLLWRLVMSPVRLAPWLGAIYGALLFCIDRHLTAIVSEGPSTELVICRKQ